MFYYMHNNNNNYYQCKMCWNKALTFGVGSIKLSFRAIVFTQYMYTKMFSIQMLLYTFQLNCAEGFNFSAFHFLVSNHVIRNDLLVHNKRTYFE